MSDYCADVICELKSVVSNYQISTFAWLIRLIINLCFYFAYYPDELENTNKFIQVNDILLFSIWYCIVVPRDLFFSGLINIGVESLFSASSNAIIISRDENIIARVVMFILNSWKLCSSKQIDCSIL